MKILHTSDWHIGISLHNVSLIEEQKYFIDCMINIIKENSIDVIIISGDIFDTAVSSAEAIGIYNYAVTKLCMEIGIPVIISSGNHDGSARLSSCSELLKKSGLYIYGKLKAEIVPVLIGNAAFYPVPYFNIDEVRALFPDEIIKTYEEAMFCITENIRKSYDKSKKNILMAHCFTGGSELSESDKSAMVGGTSIVSKAVFDGFDYVALGHLHKGQNLSKTIRYSGSPLKYAFGEVNHHKSVTIININGDNIDTEIVEIVPYRNMRVLKGNFEEVENIACRDENKYDFMKIEIADKYAGIELIEVFRQYYPNLLSIIGKTIDGDMNDKTMTVEELHSMSEVDILNKFYEETTGEKISTEQMKLFEEAIDAVANQEAVAQ